jgi:hypothetical protein
MSLPDLLKGCLNFSDCLALEIFDLLESGSNDSKCLWVDSCSREQLIDLGILSFQTLLNRLVLLLENQVSESSLLVDFIDKSMELIEKLLLLFYQVIVLLESHLVLPLNLLASLIEVRDIFLSVVQLVHNSVVLLLLLLEEGHLFIGLGQGLNDLVVGLLLVHLLLLHIIVFLPCIDQLVLKLLNDVEVGVGDLSVVVLDIKVLLVMLSR